MTTTMPDERPVALLSAPETRRFLNDFVKRRVGASDVDDVVQTVLVDALSAQRIPDTESELRRWLTGIARHKIADLHRKAGREQPSELPDVETAPAPVEERLMAEWAEEQVQKSTDAARTLQWMAREGEGEKLEQIAAEEKIEAATVRQRVSRMRRWMKERWIAELAAVAAIAVLGFFVYRWLLRAPVEVVREPGPSASPELSPVERAVPIRRAALESCKRAEYQPCLEGLDRARDLDPAGDATEEVQGAREAAKKALDLEKQAPTKGNEPGPSVDPTLSPSFDGAKKGDDPAPPTPSAPPMPTGKAPTPKPQPSFEKAAPKGKPMSTPFSKSTSLDAIDPGIVPSDPPPNAAPEPVTAQTFPQQAQPPDPMPQQMAPPVKGSSKKGAK